MLYSRWIVEAVAPLWDDPGAVAVCLCVAVLAAALAAGGCSYSFTPSKLPSHIKTVGSPVFENATSGPGIEQEITQQVTREFVADNTLQVVPEARADSGLYERILRYENRVFGYDAKGETQQYEVIIVVAIEFKDLVKRKTLWQEEEMVGRSTYYVVATTGQPPQDEVPATEAGWCPPKGDGRSPTPQMGPSRRPA